MNDQNQPNDELLPNQRYCPILYDNPSCKKVLTYSSKVSRNRAEKKGTCCTSCTRLHNPTIEYELSRKCPNPLGYINCQGVLAYKTKYQHKIAVQNNSCCRNCAALARFEEKKIHTIDRLLTEELESYYWVGFIMADGSFGDRHLALSLQSTDEAHLLRFCEYIKYKGSVYTSKPRVTKSNVNIMKSMLVTDILSITKVRDKFNLNRRKSYNPPDFRYFEDFSDEQLICIVAGLIDGDGCIFYTNTYKNVSLTFGLYENWTDFVLKIMTRIGFKFRIKHLKAKKMCIVEMHTYAELKRLKRTLMAFNLPIMNRKWDKIDLNRTSSDERYESKLAQSFALFKLGHTVIDVSDILKIKRQSVYNYHKLFLNNDDN